jgi:hypothetical protein
MVYSPYRLVGKTNWYAYLAQPEHRASLDQLGQALQCIKAIAQYLKKAAPRSLKINFCNYFGLCKLYLADYMGAFPYKTLHNQRFIGQFFSAVSS